MSKTSNEKEAAAPYSPDPPTKDDFALAGGRVRRVGLLLLAAGKPSTKFYRRAPDSPCVFCGIPHVNTVEPLPLLSTARAVTP